MIFGYCTRANKRQVTRLQKETIRKAYPDAVIVCDDFEADASYDAVPAGLARILEKSEPEDMLVVTDPAKLAPSRQALEKVLYLLNSNDLKWIFVSMPYLNYDFYAANRISLNVACSQILCAYDHLADIREVQLQNRRKGTIEAELNGVKVGRPSGLSGTSLEKYEMLRFALEHRGYASDKNIMQAIGLSNNTFYKYKKMLKEEARLAETEAPFMMNHDD